MRRKHLFPSCACSLKTKSYFHQCSQIWYIVTTCLMTLQQDKCTFCVSTCFIMSVNLFFLMKVRCFWARSVQLQPRHASEKSLCGCNWRQKCLVVPIGSAAAWKAASCTFEWLRWGLWHMGTRCSTAVTVTLRESGSKSCGKMKISTTLDCHL